MRMPIQKPGKSKQDYGTPLDLIAAVTKRFGPLLVDLAAREDNKKAPEWIGPDWDSLTQDWTQLSGNLWLNPPFANIAPWAEKCKISAPPGSDRRIFFLTPASVGSNWFLEHVHGHALVLALNPRLTFEGETACYPKDCCCSVFGDLPGFDVWRWRT